MILPVAERELRSAARQRRTYANRVSIAAVGILLFAWIAWVMRSVSWFSGPTAFSVLSWIAWCYALFSGFALVADSISSEKREGTLGLLFLTDLRGYDVVLGKLAASSVNGILGLLALFPVLAIPILMGGVTYGQFWRVILNLLNTLWFSIGIGLLVSVMSRRPGRAITAAMILVLASTFGPAIYGEILLELRYPVELVNSIQLTSPFFSQTQAMQTLAWRSNPEFWKASAGVFSVALICLGIACRAVPMVWRDRPAQPTHARWKERWRTWRFGTETQRQAHRLKLLKQNPFYWLSARERISSLGFLLLAGITVALALGIASANWGPGSPRPLLRMVITWLWATLFLHAALCFKIAASASWRLSEDRESGALDLILATPVTVGTLVRGHCRALLRQLAGPIASVLLVHGLFAWGFLLVMADEIGNRITVSELFRAAISNRTVSGIDWEVLFLFRFSCIFVVVMSVNWVALAFAGMWSGIRSGSARFAPWIAMALVFVPPPAFFCLMVWAFNDLHLFWSGDVFLKVFLATATTIVLAHAAFGSILLCRKVCRSFRAAVLQRYEPREPIRIWRLFLRIAIPAAALYLLISAAYLFEEWRGKRAWQQLQQKLLAAGESLDPAQWRPAKVPENENFAVIPLFDPIWKDASGAAGQSSGRNPSATSGDLANLSLVSLRVNRGMNPPLGNWEQGRATDFLKWRAYLSLTNTASEADSSLSAARSELLNALDIFNPELDQLKAASQRPHAVFPVTYEEGPIAFIPHAEVFTRVAEILSLRACAELASGNSVAAFKHLQLILKLAEISWNEPLVGSKQTALRLFSLALQPVWEGQVYHRWSDAQLKSLQTRFANINFAEQFQVCIRNEAIAQIHYLGWLINNPPPPTARARMTSNKFSSLLRYYPKGWVYLTQVELYETYRKARALSDPETRRFSLAELDQTYRRSSPFFVPSAFYFHLNQLAKAFASAQSSVHQATLACALERYRLAHGQYPATLDALTPNWIDAVPLDPITSTTIEYQRQNNDQFTLTCASERTRSAKHVRTWTFPKDTENQ